MLDLDSLHVLLSLRAGASGQLQIHQRRLAEDLGCKPLVLHRALRRMEDQGRLSKVGGVGAQPRTFDIVPPLKWIEK